ncbi:polysaccharide deacetylase family protein [Micromonospora yasonensis]|uniref:polysaccharide deacetylase family protein n=1 Tax=Micromonospora yasonensis TaxID=1128667 RepID=UPI0022313463|nr:polysaccharide deacetylase family protein [Micromonospora yasonensis]MCW3843901.1 polysaccharide deacetylase family protein [Micromonospora yasonensis]
MRRLPALRVTTVLTLVLGVLLSGAYLLGRPLLPHASSPDHPPSPTESPLPTGVLLTTGSAEVALTFNDGPDPTWTPLVLKALRQFHVKATFCLLGKNAQAHPELVRAIVADGHTLCNHSWDEDLGLGSRPRREVEDDLLRTSQAIRAAAPQAPITYFRAPGGNWTPQLVAIAEDLGLTSLHWTVDPQDWEEPAAAAIISTVSGGTAAGSIVLMHDGGGDRQNSVTALTTLLPDLLGRFQLEALPVDPPEHGQTGAPSAPLRHGGQQQGAP